MNQLEFEKLDVIAVLILFFVCYSIVNAEDGLVAHWSFEENGNQAKDNGNNDNVGKVIGSPKRVAGVKGQALEFDKKRKLMCKLRTVSLLISLIQLQSKRGLIQNLSTSGTIGNTVTVYLVSQRLIILISMRKEIWPVISMELNRRSG